MARTHRLERHPASLSGQVTGEMILVPLRQNTGNLEAVATLDEAGSRASKLPGGTSTRGDIRECLPGGPAARPEGPPATAGAR